MPQAPGGDYCGFCGYDSNDAPRTQARGQYITPVLLPPKKTTSTPYNWPSDAIPDKMGRVGLDYCAENISGQLAGVRRPVSQDR